MRTWRAARYSTTTTWCFVCPPPLDPPPEPFEEPPEPVVAFWAGGALCVGAGAGVLCAGAGVLVAGAGADDDGEPPEEPDAREAAVVVPDALAR